MFILSSFFHFVQVEIFVHFVHMSRAHKSKLSILSHFSFLQDPVSVVHSCVDSRKKLRLSFWISIVEYLEKLPWRNFCPAFPAGRPAGLRFSKGQRPKKRLQSNRCAAAKLHSKRTRGGAHHKMEPKNDVGSSTGRNTETLRRSGAAVLVNPQFATWFLSCVNNVVNP